MGDRSRPAIFVFTTAYHPLTGGAEIAIQEITKRLSRDFRFFIFTARMRRDLPRREERPEGAIIRIGFGSSFDKFLLPFIGVLSAASYTRRERPAAFWTVMVSYAAFIPFFLNAVRQRVPLIVTLQEGDSETHIAGARFGLIGYSWRHVLARTAALTAISRYLTDLGRRYGYRGQAEIIPNGVDIGLFKPSPQARQEIRARLGIGPDESVAITTSRLVRKNGIDVLIRAVAEFGRANQSLRLLVLGDGGERGNLERLARDRGIENRVTFLGTVPYADLPRYLAAADVYCRPSRSEGLGSAFLEAMAAGVPIVATTVGGIPDFLRDGENGLACRVDDPADCAAKLKTLLNDAALRVRMGAAGRKTVTESYQWDGVAKRFSELFGRIALRKPALLIATGIYPPDIGGPASYSKLLRDELSRRGHRVSVVTYGPSGISRRIPKGLRHFIYFCVCFRRAFSHDLVFAQDPVSAGLPAMLAAKLARRPFAIRVAGDYAWEQARQRFGVADSIDDFQTRRYGFRTELLRRVERFVVNRADIIITPSDYFRTLVSGWVHDPTKVRRVYNGIALEEIRCPSPAKAGSARTMFSAGRLVPWKGFPALIELLPDLPGWRLVIAGDGPERESLESKVKSLKLGERVRLTGGLTQAELLTELCRASVFVLNTSFESFSFQTVMAMAAGVPVVATNVGNLPEIVADGREGILVRPDDHAAITAAIKKIDGDRAFRERIIANANTKAQSFSIQRTTDELLALIAAICS